MNEEERRGRAQAALQFTIETLARNFGMTLEPVLQAESISTGYMTTRAALALKSIPGWQPDQSELSEPNTKLS